ncbi:MAG: glutamate mutase L [Chloroflexi bacterium]|nr:glutamate mutase L [Chloroflexota bacterium]
MNLTEAQSILGLDIGSIHTRAIFFDVVEESYHFIAAGSADSTYGEPYFDIGEGIFEAITQLQETTGRVFLNQDGNLIIPSRLGIEGVDRLVVTVSCGPDLRVVTFGLLNDVSLETATRLARTTYTNVLESIGINDRRPLHAQMDSLLAARPEILLIAGGTDRGATRSVARMINMITTILKVVPRDECPKVLYCGNQALAKKVKDVFEKVTEIHLTHNVRPSIDSEDLQQASLDLGAMVMEEYLRRIGGLDRLRPLCSDQPVLSGTGFQRVIRFLGTQYDPAKGVLGIDLGSAHTIAAYANRVESSLNILPVGMGQGLESVLEDRGVEEIEKWLPDLIPHEEVVATLWQKTIFPRSIPQTPSGLAIDLAAARQVLRLVMAELSLRGAFSSRSFEPILVSGSVLTSTATPQQLLLTLLDGLQPLGITPIVLDQHGIISLLGASIPFNPLFPVQVLESTAFVNLATVVTAESSSHSGTTILQARLQYASGSYIDAEIKQGSLVALPLKSRETGQLILKPLRKVRIEDQEITGNPIKIRGGVCGIVIDARGRPLELPSGDIERRDLFKHWELMLGG